MDIKDLVQTQRAFFQSGATLPVGFRVEALKKLYNAVKESEKDICAALHSDLGKSEMESYMCEVGMALSEIRHNIKHVNNR